MAIHSFPVIIEVEETALGPVMKLLHKTPGVISFHVDMDKLAKAKPNGATGGPRGRAKSLLGPVLAEIAARKHPITRKEFSAIVEANGGAKPGGGALHRYKIAGLIVRVGDKVKLAAKGTARAKQYQDELNSAGE